MSADPRRSLTLYFRNLPGPRNIKLDILNAKLEEMCSHFGTVVKVDTRKAAPYREQAWVTYESQDAADKAKQELDGWDAFGIEKKMKVAYALEASDATFMRHGDLQKLQEFQNKRKKERERRKLRPAAQSKDAARNSDKQQKAAQSKPGAQRSAAGAIPDEFLPPNKTLVVRNIPASYHDTDAFSAVFASYPGFMAVRMVAQRNLAFVDFENENLAIKPKEDLDRKDLDRSTLSITFQRA